MWAGQRKVAIKRSDRLEVDELQHMLGMKHPLSVADTVRQESS